MNTFIKAGKVLVHQNAKFKSYDYPVPSKITEWVERNNIDFKTLKNSIIIGLNKNTSYNPCINNIEDAITNHGQNVLRNYRGKSGVSSLLRIFVNFKHIEHFRRYEKDVLIIIGRSAISADTFSDISKYNVIIFTTSKEPNDNEQSVHLEKLNMPDFDVVRTIGNLSGTVFYNITRTNLVCINKEIHRIQDDFRHSTRIFSDIEETIVQIEEKKERLLRSHAGHLTTLVRRVMYKYIRETIALNQGITEEQLKIITDTMKYGIKEYTYTEDKRRKENNLPYKFMIDNSLADFMLAIARKDRDTKTLEYIRDDIKRFSSSIVHFLLLQVHANINKIGEELRNTNKNELWNKYIKLTKSIPKKLRKGRFKIGTSAIARETLNAILEKDDITTDKILGQPCPAVGIVPIAIMQKHDKPFPIIDINKINIPKSLHQRSMLAAVESNFRHSPAEIIMDIAGRTPAGVQAEERLINQLRSGDSEKPITKPIIDNMKHWNFRSEKVINNLVRQADYKTLCECKEILNSIAEGYAFTTRTIKSSGKKIPTPNAYNYIKILDYIVDGIRCIPMTELKIKVQKREDIHFSPINLDTMSLTKLIRNSAYNHNQSIILSRALIKELPVKPMPISEPYLRVIDPDILKLRLSNNHEMVQAGIELRHCIGSYTDSSDLFFRNGTVCAQFRVRDNIVHQCHDIKNSATDASKAFTRLLNIEGLLLNKTLVRFRTKFKEQIYQYYLNNDGARPIEHAKFSRNGMHILSAEEIRDRGITSINEIPKTLIKEFLALKEDTRVHIGNDVYSEELFRVAAHEVNIVQPTLNVRGDGPFLRVHADLPPRAEPAPIEHIEPIGEVYEQQEYNEGGLSL